MDYTSAYVGVVDASCFQDYFGFGGRAFADAEALSGGATTSGAQATLVPALRVAATQARKTLRAGAAAGKCVSGRRLAKQGESQRK